MPALGWSRCAVLRVKLSNAKDRLGQWMSNLKKRKGKDFLRVQYVPPVEGIAQADHHIKVFLGEQPRHQVALFHPDAVLPGDGAAALNAELEDLGACRQHALKLLRIT